MAPAMKKRRRRAKKSVKKRSKRKRKSKKKKSKKRRKKKSKKKRSKKKRKKRSKKKKSKRKKRKSKRKVKKRSGKKKGKAAGGGACKLVVTRSSQKSKHLKAVFSKGGKKVATVHFGPNKKTQTFLTGCSAKAKAAWLKANKKLKKLKNCKHPGALEYHLCFGDSNDLAKNLAAFKHKFKLA